MLSVDRIEDNYAVCVDNAGEIFHVELFLVDSKVKEGDILIFDNGRYKIDEQKTKSEREEIEALQDKLFE